ncbi:MAG: hypothetical protein V2A64_01610 [Candidatus Omnitrophota bacterium]
MRKAQAMIFVLFILAVFGAIAGALTVMWQTEIQTRSAEKDSLSAIYLAQAGIERAKLELAYNEAWPGAGPFAFAGGTYNISVLAIACPPGPYNTCREITSTGLINAADRRIVVDVSLDSPPPDPPDTAGDEAVLPWTWREI